MSVKLLYYPNAKLLTVCEEVIDFDQELVILTSQMLKIMQKHKGLGISANQIGSNKRVCLVLTKQGPVEIVVNPKVLEVDGDIVLQEGCLSAPGIFLPIKRPENVYFSYQDVTGKEKKAVAYGQDARCLLHEIEHLEGKFYFDNVAAVIKANAEAKLREELK